MSGFAEAHSRPSMKAIFSPAAVAKSKSVKLQRLSASLSWRQRYQTADEYPYEFNEGGNTFSVSQVANGELKGLGTGTFVWPAAHVLAKFLEKNFRDRNDWIEVRVCEIGSGTGLTGLAAAGLGADVHLTDQAPILTLLQDNVERACSSCRCMESTMLHVSIYDWGNEDHVHALSPPFDMLLISDCVLPKLYPIEPLIKSVDALLGDSSVAYFSYEHRPYPLFDPRHEFCRLATKYGLHVEIVPSIMHDDVFSAEDIEIWEVRRAEFKDMPLKLSVMNRKYDNKDTTDNISTSSLQLSLSSTAIVGSSLTFDDWGDLEQVHAQMLVSYLDEDTKGEKKSFILPVTINQAANSTTGSYLWPSSAILSRYLLTNYFIADKSDEAKAQPLAIDLGAGCGLTTMTLLLTGFNVVATDKECSIDILTENLSNFKKGLNKFLALTLDSGDSMGCFCMNYLDSIARGGKHNLGQSEVVNVDWTQLDASKANITNSLPHQAHSYPDVIVCSDCLYTSSSAEALALSLENICGPDTIVYICNQLRSALDEFLSYVRKSSYYTRGQSVQGVWEIDEIPLSQADHTICRNISGLVVSPPLRFLKMKFIRSK